MVNPPPYDSPYPFTHERYVGFWAPRMGLNAAEARFRQKQTQIAGWLCLVIAGLGVGLGVRGNVPVVELVGFLFFAISVGLVVWGFVLDPKVMRLTRELLGDGRRLVGGSLPPENNKRYEAWCRENNIIAYAAVTHYEKKRSEQNRSQVTSPFHKPDGVTTTSRPESAISQPTATAPVGFTKPAAASPPTWQPDPTGRFAQRYFDGTSWTAWVIDAGGAEIQDPQGAPNLAAP